MKALTLMLVMVLAAGAVAQTASMVALSDGSSIAARLMSNLKANKLNAGDEVLAEVVVPVLDRGRIVIPAGARVVGEVVSSNARSKQNPESKLSVRFERVEWKGGSAAVSAYIVGLLAGMPGRAQRDNCAPRSRFMANPPISQMQQSQGPNTLNGVRQPIHNTGPSPMQDPSLATGMPCLVAGPPDFSHISVRKLDAPKGATQLVSATKTISLPKGITVELRQVAP